jgi:hypothetical protein
MDGSRPDVQIRAIKTMLGDVLHDAVRHEIPNGLPLDHA